MKLPSRIIDACQRQAFDAGVIKQPRRRAAEAAPGAPPVRTAEVAAAVQPLTRAAVTPLAAERAADDPGSTTRRLATASETGFVLTKTDFERMMGLNDLVEESYLKRALLAARPVMRIVLRTASNHEVGYATGFMVSPTLLLTNHHVFPNIKEAENAIVEANYVNDVRGVPERSYRFLADPARYYASHKDLDWALVAVQPTSEEGAGTLASFGYHRLVAQHGKIKEGESITLVQHPAGQRRQYAIRENQFLKYHGDQLWYSSDTAPGSSGAPAFNDAFQVVGLHSAGAPKESDDGLYVLKDGTKVASLDDVSEDRILWEANAGVRISKVCESFATTLPQNDELTNELYRSMEGGDVLERAEEARPTELATPGVSVTRTGGLAPQVQINVNVKDDKAVRVEGPSTAPAAPASAFVEKVPIIDRDYDGRTGHDTNFLGVEVPFPTLETMEFVSRMDDGDHVIPYQNFSVVLNKKRRMAYFTIADVDGSKEAREPEPGKNYSRKGLAGLGPNDRETWLTDSRVPAMHQLPDRFYNKDRSAFDKGHIVQRDSVCWGDSYDTVRRANGDTYHVTNCSPQTARFNQSAQDKDNWGDLENEILKQAKNERLVVIAGPVFNDDDPDFHGVDDFGEVVVPVPRKYWKVVVAETDEGLQSFAFLIEQDLENVEFEFFVPSAWKKQTVKMAKLAALIAPVKLPQVVVDAGV